MLIQSQTSSANSTQDIISATRRELVILHENLLKWERSYQGAYPPISDNNVQTCLSNIIAVAKPYQHYDCFSFAQAVLYCAGFNVPTFSIPNCSDAKRSLKELAPLLARETFDKPEEWFASEAFRLNAVAQGTKLGVGTIANKCAEITTLVEIDFTNRYLFLVYKEDIIHGMLVLGATSRGEDLWILHRNDTTSLATVELLSTIEKRYDNLFNPPDADFRRYLDLVLSPPIAQIEATPHPDQTLIDLVSAYRKQISTELSVDQIAKSSIGIFQFFSVCAQALISEGKFTEHEVLTALEESGNTQYKSRFEESIKSAPYPLKIIQE